MARQFGATMLGSIELFCLAAELGSFTAAATACGLTPAAVSRAISRLEEKLGTRLFVRTTRRIRLSEGGEAYYRQCRQALGQLNEAERELTGQQSSPVGTVRLSLPTPFGHYRVLPLLPAFRARYPAVELEVQLSNRNIDFASDDYDLAVRGRNPPDSGLVVRKLEEAELVVVASPDYLARAGVPHSLADLPQHDCLQFVLPSSGQRVNWLFREQGHDIDLPTRGGICCSEDLLGGLTLARHGGGLLQTCRFIVERDLAAGTLVEVMQDFGGRSRPFSLLYPRNRHMPLRVRVLIDFLLAEVGKVVAKSG
ncbi:LysR family transcriptional regulator [Chitinimonas lacunae]|uniref:LysR family transcriptional regulator n=1 Tax=Chitinimonas lacunae TaxID=1963018 RepID=A0ABV8MQ21_9NEIS